MAIICHPGKEEAAEIKHVVFFYFYFSCVYDVSSQWLYLDQGAWLVDPELIVGFGSSSNTVFTNTAPRAPLTNCRLAAPTRRTVPRTRPVPAATWSWPGRGTTGAAPPCATAAGSAGTTWEGSTSADVDINLVIEDSSIDGVH